MALTFNRKGNPTVEVNLGKLYSSDGEIQAFMERFKRFKQAINDDDREIYTLNNHILQYRTECLIPKQIDNRRPLLLLLGNPAPHSVREGMFFSYQHQVNDNISEHRFWRSLNNAGILSFNTPFDNYQERKREFLHDQQSKYLIGLSVFYTMPSPPSHNKWGGVSGLKKLFGATAFREITCQEKYRTEKIIQKFCGNNGVVIVFQKDAYLAIRDVQSPDYNIGMAREGRLIGQCIYNTGVKLFCAPPTRYNNAEILIRFIREIPA